MLTSNVLRYNVSAIYAGSIIAPCACDPRYSEDSILRMPILDRLAPIFVRRDRRIIEVQGTSEKTPFSEVEFLALMARRAKACRGWWICRKWPGVA